MELRFACPQCGTINRRPDADRLTILDCTECSYAGLIPDGWTEHGVVERCPICGCGEIFKQKDFQQRTGIIIALVGASFAVFTRFLSIFLAAVICGILYIASPERLVCYLCRTQVVGHRRTRAHRRFSARVAEKLRIDAGREPEPEDSRREIR